MSENIVGHFRTREEAEACRDWFEMPDTFDIFEDDKREAHLVLTGTQDLEIMQLSLLADAFRAGLDAWHTIYRSQRLRAPINPDV